VISIGIGRGALKLVVVRSTDRSCSLAVLSLSHSMTLTLGFTLDLIVVPQPFLKDWYHRNWPLANPGEFGDSKVVFDHCFF